MRAGGGDVRSSSDILDTGVHGLRHVQELAARYLRIAPDGYTPEQLRESYDEQRGVNLGQLAHAAAAVEQANLAACEHYSRQDGLADELASAWVDGSAPVPRIARVAGVTTTLDNAAAAFGAAATALHSVVQRKADTAASFASDHIAGATLADVDGVIAAADTGRVTDPVLRLFPQLTADESAAAEQVAQLCSDWLSNVFAPRAEAILTGFMQLCQHTDDAVRTILATLGDALSEVDDSSEQERDDTGASTQPSDGDTTTASDSGAATGGAFDGIGETIVSLIDEFTPVAVEAIKAGGQVAQALSETVLDTITAIGDQIAEHAPDDPEQVPGDDSPPSGNQPPPEQTGAAATGPDPAPAIEFDVPGTHVRIAEATGGEVSLDVTGADGHAETYTLQFGRDGTPTIAPEVPATAPPVGEVPQAPPPAPNPVPPVLAAQSARRTTSEESAPPAAPAPAPPPDVGAILAEAGPL
ncbi:hypothetical protein FOS14_01555 [Skermania sp. ID1734]|uniref:hypothetical protein n=1 Tax=Skermania sp. ID1734 TaxID=2597516 RepID=UPI00117C6A40|nr:hypothetical protein [Skermania sp. ID1734]TSE02095.1 hypothetical protein FOS14_01555 [Skermania sp. ID1734]